jgi:3-hydroxyacyl-CoA dehydrogenase
MTQEVLVTDDRGIRTLTLQNPPVNALSASLKETLLSAVQSAASDSAVTAIVLRGAGGKFSAGADIPAFKTGRTGPRISDVTQAIEALGKPSVALIEGFALGGGLELALGCAARVAAPDARLGLPEVELGIMPGAGGLQRLPRLIGLAAAAELIATGRKIEAAAAMELGIIDRVCPPDDFLAVAADLIADAEVQARVPLSGRPLTADPVARDALQRLRDTVGGRRGPSQAQRVILDRLEHSIDADFDAALATDGTATIELREGQESKALRHMFAAERKAVRLNDAQRATQPPRRVAVAGAGTMGTGIVLATALGGMPVTLFDPDAGARDRAVQRIAAFAKRRLSQGRLTEAAALRDRVDIVDSLDAFAPADLVIEAVVEDMNVKRDLFRRLESICGPETVFATNTSFLELHDMAAVLSDPSRLIGLHFFAPAEIMRLLEAVRGAQSSDTALALGLAYGRAIGKTTIPMNDCSGFAANRSRFPMMNEARLIVEDGAAPAQVDAVFRDFGFAMGPFETNDQGGIDVFVKGFDFVPKRMRPERQARLPFTLFDLGRLGQKTGYGYYRYEEGSRTPLPDPELDAILATFRADQGITPRTFSDQDILERCLFAAINEAVRVVADGIVARPSDMDVVWVHGFGFPRDKGGLLYWAEQTGFDRIEARINQDFRPENPERWPLADFGAVKSHLPKHLANS